MACKGPLVLCQRQAQMPAYQGNKHMQKRVTFLGAVALATSLSGWAMAQDAAPTAETVVATVGDVDITLGEMIIARGQLPQQYSQLPIDVLWEGLLDQIVQQQLLAQERDETPLRVELALKNDRRSMMAGEVISVYLDAAVTEEDIQAAYESRVAEAPVGVEYNASHLLVETEEEALAALERVQGGEEFADVARDVSTGPTGPNGGNLGWFGEGQMVAPFEEAVKALEAGGVSGPVQTQFGWHIVTLNETRPLEQPTLEDMREEITRELQGIAIDEYVAQLTEAAGVTLPEEGAFDPNLLNEFSLLEPTSE